MPSQVRPWWWRVGFIATSVGLSWISLHSVVLVAKSRLSVGHGAMATPPSEAALKGVAVQLSLLQRKHRFAPLQPLDCVAEADLAEFHGPEDDSADGKGAHAVDLPPEAALTRLRARARELDGLLASHPCATLKALPALARHEARRQWLRERIDELQRASASSADAISLRSDASKRQRVLRRLGYVQARVDGDEGDGGPGGGGEPAPRLELTLKGRVACELTATSDELILSETVCSGLLHPLDAPEVAGLLSMFVSKGSHRAGSSRS